MMNLSIEANSVDPEQTIWVHTVCHRGFLNISADEQRQRTFIATGALSVKVLQTVVAPAFMDEYSFPAVMKY